jgi:antitoxin (DNA-binding transcriptional repressor) of toxin-antitoxin stability system
LVGRAEQGEPSVGSRHGKPVAVMLRLDMDTEDVLLANSSALAERRAQAMEELRPGQFIDASDLDEALGTKSAPSDGRREPDST